MIKFVDILERPHSCYNRWRPLEASLAAIGSQSETILDCIEDELESGRDKPIDIEYILRDIVPSVLSLSGRSFLGPRMSIVD